MVKRLFSFLVICVVAITVSAQVTTAGIEGKVIAEGEEAIGATVQAVHLGSGSKYTAVTNTKGHFTISGMRVGGPYTIKISYIGSDTKTFSDVYLRLGESLDLSCKLTTGSQELQTVVVTGHGFDATKTGTGASFNNQTIETTPTINRNVYDVVKINPFIADNKNNGISIAGTNNRYNSFQIDGAISNDVFGLTSSGTNGGQSAANPISIDAIEQIEVNIAPFDVRQSGFTGGAINAVTKSGTNQFHGSAYGYFNNQDFYGKWNQYTEKDDPMTDQSTQTYGFTVGGPIIKNKLFFFASAEYKYEKYPCAYYPGVIDDYISVEDAQKMIDRYYAATGIHDSFGKRDVKTKGLGILARLDWNINTANKLTFRWQMNDSEKDNAVPSSSTYYFNNSGYKMSNTTNTFVAELNSRLSDVLHNEARVTASFVRDNRKVPYQGPTIYITKVPVGTGSRTINLDLGTEYSSGVNFLDQDVYTIDDNLSWYRGNHTFTFGTHNEIFNMKNGYIQYANGEYAYSSLQDFYDNNCATFYYKYSDVDMTGTPQWAAGVKAGQFGLFAQDKWNVTDLFSLTYGVRFDMPVMFNSPTTNPEFNNSLYARANDVEVGRKPNAQLMVSPRLGFRWYLNESRKTLLRGGTGLFTGRVPFVWLSNCWSNTGMEMKGTTIYGANFMKLENWQQNLIDVQTGKVSGVAGKPDICTVDKSFRYPQAWRTNIALEQILPGDVKMTLEALYSKQYNNVFFENLALLDNGGKVYAVPGVEASAATNYGLNTGSYTSIVNLKNTNKGYSYSLSAKFEKSFNFGLDLMAAYTFGHSKSVNDATSSVAYSNWKGNASVNSNEQELGYSIFDVPHRIVASIMYHSKKYLGGRLNTDAALTYNGSNGMRYSLTLSESTSAIGNSTSYNGDGYAGNSLMYIPTDEELQLMKFGNTAKYDETGNQISGMTPEQHRDAFQHWIEGDDYAKDHRGQYADRYGCQAPFEHHFDFHLAENFYYNKKGGKIAVSLDILNVANLLNKKWGAYYNSTTYLTPLYVNKAEYNTDGNKEVTFTYQDTNIYKNAIQSRWHMQLGVKVTF